MLNTQTQGTPQSACILLCIESLQLDALSPAVDVLTSELSAEITRQRAVQVLAKAVNVSLLEYPI